MDFGWSKQERNRSQSVRIEKGRGLLHNGSQHVSGEMAFQWVIDNRANRAVAHAAFFLNKKKAQITTHTEGEDFVLRSSRRYSDTTEPSLNNLIFYLVSFPMSQCLPLKKPNPPNQ